MVQVTELRPRIADRYGDLDEQVTELAKRYGWRRDRAWAEAVSAGIDALNEGDG